MMKSTIAKWYNYIFKRNPFSSTQEEWKYVKKILNERFQELGGDFLYENYLLRVVPKKSCIYVEMKSRGCGYIITR